MGVEEEQSRFRSADLEKLYGIYSGFRKLDQGCDQASIGAGDIQPH